MSNSYNCRILSNSKTIDGEFFATDDGENNISFQETPDTGIKYTYKTEDVQCYGGQIQYLIRDFEKISRRYKTNFTVVFHDFFSFEVLEYNIEVGQTISSFNHKYDSIKSKQLIGQDIINGYLEM